MRFKVLLVFLTLVFAASLLAFPGCTQPTTEPPTTETPAIATPEEVLLEAYTSEYTEWIYRVFFAAADILQRTGSWVRISPVESPGAQYNIEYLAELDADRKAKTIINILDSAYWLARDGVEPYTQKHSDLRILAGFNASVCTWITLDPDIKTHEDMIGKSVGLLPSFFGLSPYVDCLVNDVWELGDKAQCTRMLFGPAIDALKDGLMDCVIMGAAPAEGETWTQNPGGLLDPLLVANKVVYAINVPEADWLKVGEIMGQPVRTGTIPAGTWGPGQSEDVVGFRLITTIMACDASLDEDVAYELVKTLAENSDQFAQYLPFGEHITAQWMLDLCPIQDVSELHPGALKYYREVGVIE